METPWHSVTIRDFVVKKSECWGWTFARVCMQECRFLQKKKRIQAELVNCRQEAKIHWYGTSAGVLQPLP